MRTNIHGAIEIRGTMIKEMANQWVYFADLTIVYSRVFKIYRDLFDAYDDNAPYALFAKRGLPGSVTVPTVIAHQKTAKEQITGKTHHASWFTWDELEASGWLENWEADLESLEWYGQPERNWDALFNILSVIAKNYGAKNVRVVVWFEG